MNASSAVCDVIIAASMTHYVCFAFICVFFFPVFTFNSQLSRRKSAFRSTQRMIRRLTRMVIETGTLTGQHEITLVIFSRLNLITTWTAVIAVINLVMFQIPGVSYYQAASEVLGKMYSNTMMMNLNSRMVSWFGVTNDTVLNEPSTDLRFVLSTSNGGISVTREEWIDGFTWRLKASLYYKTI